MVAENKIEFDQLSNNTTNPDLIARAATNFLFENSGREAKEYLEKDDDYNKLHER